MAFSKILKWSIALIVLTFIAILYNTYNPEVNSFFPKCLFKQLTDLQCPGCGSQRAIHHLLNFNISEAFQKNALLVISIPYILLGLIFDFIENANKTILKWRKILFGRKAIFLILLTILIFWISRNV